LQRQVAALERGQGLKDGEAGDLARVHLVAGRGLGRVGQLGVLDARGDVEQGLVAHL
jgi:hypothetical protein